jgi:hypothetical protein
MHKFTFQSKWLNNILANLQLSLKCGRFLNMKRKVMCEESFSLSVLKVAMYHVHLLQPIIYNYMQLGVMCNYDESFLQLLCNLHNMFY